MFNAWNTLRRNLAKEAMEPLMTRHPEAVERALAVINHNLIQYALATLERGTAGIFLSVPASAEFVTREQYERFMRPFDLELLNALKGKGEFHLVQEQGWLKFREIEYDLCRRFSQMKNVVVALGGGTVRYAWNVDILRGTGVTVLLEADLKTLADRVRKADRPRVNSGVSLEKDLESIWSAAGHLYRQAADLVYRTDAAQDIDGEVADLLNLLAQNLLIPLV